MRLKANPTFLSPVKINLFLHITGRRPDGYHLLQTLFQFLEWGDEIEFNISDDGRLQRFDQHEFDIPENDLCLQAASLLRNEFGSNQLGVKITLRKKVAPGTGLGAGSSNAATTLLVLNHLWKLHLNTDQLIRIGRILGADIPIFLHGNSAWAEGVGDQFTSHNPDCFWYCVLIPDSQISTAEIFSDSDLVRNHPTVDYRNFANGNTGNDLEGVTIKKYPAVGVALKYLSGFGNARMSGTGSSVFVAVENQEQGATVLQNAPAGCGGFIARSTNLSPLHRQLKSFESE